jgi:hypothetical protein
MAWFAKGRVWEGLIYISLGRVKVVQIVSASCGAGDILVKVG